MGISLRNIAKKINPFYQDRAVSDNSQMIRQVQNAKYGVLANNPVAQQNFIRANQAPRPSITRGIDTAAAAVGNAANKVVVQPFITRPAAEIVSTIRNKPYNPGSAFEQSVFGPSPVAPIQQKVADQYTRHRNSNNAALRTASAPLAVGEGLLSIANDIPVVGALTKGVTKTGKAVVGLKGSKPIQEAAQDIKIPVNQKPGPRTKQVDVTVNKRIPVKSMPSQDELIDNYNAHISALNKQYSRNAKPSTLAKNKGVISEPSIYNDVDYQAKRQVIEQAYKEGTLSKPISVQDAPKTQKAKVAMVENEIKGITRSPLDDKAPVSMKVLNSKIKNVKDPKRKAELIAEREARLPKKPVVAINPITPGKVGAADKALRGSANVLEKIDPRLGSGVKQRRELGETGAAAAKFRVRENKKLTEAEQENMADVLEGKASPVNNKVAAAAQNTRAELDRAHKIANAVGIESPYRKNHFPHIHDPKTFQKGTTQHQEAVSYMIRSGQAKSEAEATRAIMDFGENSIYGGASTKVSPYKNLTEARTLDLPGYTKNADAVEHYLDRAYASIAHAHVFGPKEEKLTQMLDEIGAGGGREARAAAETAYRQASNLDRGSNTARKVSGALTTVQGMTKMGTSSIGNVTQLSNTATVFGARRTIKAQYKLARNQSDRDFVKKTGVTDEEVAHEALFGEQGISTNANIPGTKIKVRSATSPAFQPIEQNNRAVTAIAGRDEAMSLATKVSKGNKKAADKLLQDYGIKNVGPEGLTEAQQIKAARTAVARTQFRSQAQDLPGWTSTNWGKVLTQFKRYPYFQSQFLWNEVMRPAMRGNLKPLARWGTIAAPFALGTNELRQKLRRDDFQETGIKKALGTVSTVTGGDIATSLVNQLYPTSKDSTSYTSKVAKTLAGPTGSDAIKGLEAGFDATKGDYKAAERLGLTHIPTVGPTVSNTLLPYDKKPKAGTTEAKKGDATAEIKKLKDNVGEGYTLQQLSDGRYAYNLDGEIHIATSYKTASRAIAKDAFAKSDDQEKVVGKIYYYKDEAGDVHTKTIKPQKVANSSKPTVKSRASGKASGGSHSSTALMPGASNYSVKSYNAKINNPRVALRDTSRVRTAYKAPSVKLKKARTNV